MTSQQEDKENSEIPSIKVDNPFGLPKAMLITGEFYNGAPLKQFLGKEDPLAHVKNIRAMPMREDDVLLLAFPKSGTHWLSEILSKLLKINYSFASRSEQNTMFEFLDDFKSVEDLKPPRFFNSHMSLAHLPEQIVEKKVKIVHVIRNPKDVIVSNYHHAKQVANDKFTFDAFVEHIVTPKAHPSLEYMFGFLRQMEQFQKDHPDHPVLNIHFEDIKKDPIAIIQEVAKFLGQTLSEEEAKEVKESTGFDKLKKNEAERKVGETKLVGFNKVNIYRKGIVGDWKNSFTVAQNELVDEFIKRNQKDLNIPFRGL